MDIQQLDNVDLSILEEIERRSQQEESVSVDETISRQMKTLCDEATKKLKADYGEDALVFEIAGPAQLPTDTYEQISLIGMEEVTFEKLTFSQKASIICVFYYKEQNKRILLKATFLPRVFGARGDYLLNWINANVDVSKKRQEILRKLEAQASESDYKGVESYGAW